MSLSLCIYKTAWSNNLQEHLSCTIWKCFSFNPITNVKKVFHVSFLSTIWYVEPLLLFSKIFIFIFSFRVSWQNLSTINSVETDRVHCHVLQDVVSALPSIIFLPSSYISMSCTLISILASTCSTFVVYFFFNSIAIYPLVTFSFTMHANNISFECRKICSKTVVVCFLPSLGNGCLSSPSTFQLRKSSTEYSHQLYFLLHITFGLCFTAATVECGLSIVF